MGVVLVLAGCSGGEVASPPTVTHTVTAEAATVTHEVEVTTTVTAEGPTETGWTPVPESFYDDAPAEDMVFGMTSEDSDELLEVTWELMSEENRQGVCDLGSAGRASMAESLPEVIGVEIPADEVLDFFESVC